jgi:hypothetical protein
MIEESLLLENTVETSNEESFVAKLQKVRQQQKAYLCEVQPKGNFSISHDRSIN